VINLLHELLLRRAPGIKGDGKRAVLHMQWSGRQIAPVLRGGRRGHRLSGKSPDAQKEGYSESSLCLNDRWISVDSRILSAPARRIRAICLQGILTYSYTAESNLTRADQSIRRLQMLQEHSRLCFWYRMSDGSSPLHIAAGQPDA